MREQHTCQNTDGAVQGKTAPNSCCLHCSRASHRWMFSFHRHGAEEQKIYWVRRAWTADAVGQPASWIMAECLINTWNTNSRCELRNNEGIRFFECCMMKKITSFSSCDKYPDKTQETLADWPLLNICLSLCDKEAAVKRNNQLHASKTGLSFCN